VQPTSRCAVAQFRTEHYQTMRPPTRIFATVPLVAACQILAVQVLPVYAQTISAYPPQTETLERESPARTKSMAVIGDQKPDAAAAIRAITDQGLFAEEYDAILEAAQDDPQLFAKIVECITRAAK
jgi:hypothetical protein